jgi:3-oxoadipate enol-lactonase
MSDTVPLLADAGGPRDAPVVVLLHGFPFSRAIWSSVLGQLSQSYRVYAPDLRGHGATPAPDEPTSMEAMAKDVLAFMDKEGVERFTLIGHSMGGYVAFELERLAPERVDALVLVTTRATGDADAVKANRRKQADLVHLEGVSALANLLLPKLLAPNPNRVTVEEARRMMEANSVTGVTRALDAMAERRDHGDHLPEIKAPTLVIAGGEDQVMPRAEQERLAREIPNARLEAVNGAGHLPMMEKPEEFLSVLKAFLDETARK